MIGFKEFCLLQDPKVKDHWDWRVDVMCEELEKVAVRKLNGIDKLYDLSIFSYKHPLLDRVCSELFPAWIWVIDTQNNIGNIMSSQTASNSISRNILYTLKYCDMFYGEISTSRHGYFDNKDGGYMKSLGSSGTVAGLRFDFMIFSDSDINCAGSILLSQRYDEWLNQTICTRVGDNYKSPIVMVGRCNKQYFPKGWKRPVKYIEI